MSKQKTGNALYKTFFLPKRQQMMKLSTQLLQDGFFTAFPKTLRQLKGLHFFENVLNMSKKELKKSLSSKFLPLVLVLLASLC